MAKIKNKDIANALNVSTTAVSLALNNKPGISDATRKRIIDYYHRHFDVSSLPIGTEPSKSLILEIYKSSGKIVIDKPFFSDMIAEIEKQAKQNGYLLTISHYDPNTPLSEHVQYLNDLSASGVLLLATEITDAAYEEYRNLYAPFVLLDGSLDTYPHDSVTLDNTNAIYQAYRYAYEQGHRNIGYLKCKTDIPNFIHRLDGFYKARKDFEPDLKEDPCIFSLSGNLEDSNMEMKEILSSIDDLSTLPTCFLSDLDYISIGASLAFRDSGLLIPDDISIIGYDDIEFSSIVNPPLTTLHLHQKTLGKTAVQLLIERLKDPKSSALTKQIQIASELVIRKSVKNLSGISSEYVEA